MNKSIIFILVAALVLVSTGSSVNAQASRPTDLEFAYKTIKPISATIGGTITKRSIGVTKVLVNLEQLVNNKWIKVNKTITGNNGTYKFNITSTGNYRITPTKYGLIFTPQYVIKQINANGFYTVSFTTK